MAAPKTRILVLGGTGYIGGTILSELLHHQDQYDISALVRRADQAAKLDEVGAKSIRFESLGDINVIRAAAADHDIVVAAASARHESCAKACIEGLGERQRRTGNTVHYIHTSGASMIGDWPVSGERVDTSFHSDLKEDIFMMEKTFPESYSQVRAINQVVVHTGEREHVKTYIVIPPLIFGTGTGLFATSNSQVGSIVELSLAHQPRQAVVVGKGEGVWSRVSIVDVSHLFYLLVQAVGSASPPFGKEGYYFVENGSQSWMSISQKIGEVFKAKGIASTDEVAGITLKEAGDALYGGSEREAEAILASK
ncbi:NAD dependent epimerase family protein [Coleophoma cylindrospora]|uniref:NAD dependent epimerase family protein n=1 Tax=Coleophoma cylindrospora TaxID=1849047 RepID=A0A3D8QXG7_9HELO|nr:NAD dependent epimerase family protein [Coleophoma cylindrospora]